MINRNLRTKLMLVLALAVTLPLIGSGYVLINRAEEALMVEKESKLFGIARTLDNSLSQDYDSLLTSEEQRFTREQKIHLLNARLAEVTDQIALANPGVGVGYYSKELDAIITYGPSSEYDYTIGQSIGLEHKGRDVMAQGIPSAVTGAMVRGNILNAMVPLIRNGQAIGYAWANELTVSIWKQIRAMTTVMYLALGIALSVGLGIALPLADQVSNSVHHIISGLRRLRDDLTYRLPAAGAEFGEITRAINEMAQNLMNSRHLAAVGELAAGVAHEIRNPLAAISGSVQILIDELPADHSSRVLGDVIIKESNRLNSIVEDLLYFAKPSKSNVTKVNPNELIRETLTLMAPLLNKGSVALQQNLDPAVSWVFVDSEHIKQVLINLLLNAIQALPNQGGEVGVSSVSASEGVKIIIRDSGTGILPENLSRIFDPFFTTKDRGTGLGLAVSAKIIEIHRGQIWVESDVGAGSTFYLFLPYGNDEERV